MKFPRNLMPTGLAGRLTLLMVIALLVANLVALGLITTQRERLDRQAREDREVERLISLVPAIEAVDPALRGAIARRASSRSSRIAVSATPIITESNSEGRAAALEQRLLTALPGRTIRVAILAAPIPNLPRDLANRNGPPDPPAQRELIAASISLEQPDGAPALWLNVLTTGIRADPGGNGQDIILLILILSLASVLGVGLIFVRNLVRPLDQLAEAARAAGRGDRSVRVAETGPREVSEAARAFNDMQARIARFDAERMRSLAAIGHDLRTPITSLRIRAEMLDPDEGAPMIATLEDMTVMADGLIAYARGASDSEEPTRLELAPFLARLCEERGARYAGGPDTAIHARKVGLGRAIGNLIDNALRYGGSAEVALTRAADEVAISVSDRGPGIPTERLGDIQEPFVRGEESRNAETGGAGLGLSIARSIAIAHGGQLTLENREGGGLLATIHLPVGKMR